VATLKPLAIYAKVNNPGVPDTEALKQQWHKRHRHVGPAWCADSPTIGA